MNGKIFTDIQKRQVSATIERSVHSLHIVGVEAAQVKVCQVGAITEHLLHRCDTTSIEIAYVERLQTSAT